MRRFIVWCYKCGATIVVDEELMRKALWETSGRDICGGFTDAVEVE